MIFLSPLTTVDIFSEGRSHGDPPEGEGLRLSISFGLFLSNVNAYYGIFFSVKLLGPIW